MIVLKIWLDLSLYVSHKDGKLSETFLENDFKFALSKRDSTIIFNLGLVLLPVKVDLISEKQDQKRDLFRAHSISRIKMVLTLLTEVVTLYIKAIIV